MLLQSTSEDTMIPENRIAPDGNAYTLEEFLDFYGPTYGHRKWCHAPVAATEHVHSDTPTHMSPTQCPSATSAADATEHTHDTAAAPILQPATAGDGAADATELSHTSAHAPELRLQSASAMPAPATAGDSAADATELSQTSAHTPEHALVLMPAASTISPLADERLLQCVECKRPLCSTEDLAFFWRANKQGGVEVHLMLKPENKEPATFIRSHFTERGAMASWQCACGFKLGDTRAVAVNKAAMTAFKSSSVMLCGQRFPGRKSKWPSIYNQPPFSTIEGRTRDTFNGTSSIA